MEVTERKDMVIGIKVIVCYAISFVNCNVRLISDLFLFQDTCLNNRTRRDTNKKDTATTNKVTIS